MRCHSPPKFRVISAPILNRKECCCRLGERGGGWKGGRWCTLYHLSGSMQCCACVGKTQIMMWDPSHLLGCRHHHLHIQWISLIFHVFAFHVIFFMLHTYTYYYISTVTGSIALFFLHYQVPLCHWSYSLVTHAVANLIEQTKSSSICSNVFLLMADPCAFIL